jgi:hypothetical protein
LQVPLFAALLSSLPPLAVTTYSYIIRVLCTERQQKEREASVGEGNKHHAGVKGMGGEESKQGEGMGGEEDKQA